jgi:hypothetical protein
MAVLVGLIALFGVWPDLALDFIGDYTSILMGVF